jgi:hypothetical protein
MVFEAIHNIPLGHKGDKIHTPLLNVRVRSILSVFSSSTVTYTWGTPFMATRKLEGDVPPGVNINNTSKFIQRYLVKLFQAHLDRMQERKNLEAVLLKEDIERIKDIIVIDYNLRRAKTSIDKVNFWPIFDKFSYKINIFVPQIPAVPADVLRYCQLIISNFRNAELVAELRKKDDEVERLPKELAKYQKSPDVTLDKIGSFLTF